MLIIESLLANFLTSCFILSTVDDERTSKKYQEIKSFEERCIDKFRHSKLTTLRGTLEEEVAKISDR